ISFFSSRISALESLKSNRVDNSFFDWLMAFSSSIGFTFETISNDGMRAILSALRENQNAKETGLNGESCYRLDSRGLALAEIGGRGARRDDRRGRPTRSFRVRFGLAVSVIGAKIARMNTARICVLLVCSLPLRAAVDWPEFRGPSGDGHVRDNAN